MPVVDQGLPHGHLAVLRAIPLVAAVQTLLLTVADVSVMQALAAVTLFTVPEEVFACAVTLGDNTYMTSTVRVCVGG